MRRRAAYQLSHKSLAAHLASLNTCRLIGGRTFKVNHHAPAGGVPAIPQKSGGAFGIPEYMPPNRRQDFQGKSRIECSSETVFCSRSVSRKGCRRLEDTVFCCGVNAPAAHFITKYPARRALSDWILLKNVVAATYFSAETVYDTVQKRKRNSAKLPECRLRFIRRKCHDTQNHRN